MTSVTLNYVANEGWRCVSIQGCDSRPEQLDKQVLGSHHKLFSLVFHQLALDVIQDQDL